MSADAIDWHAVVTRFGHEVRALRTLAGYSQTGLALIARTSQGTVSRLERGDGYLVPLVSAMKVAVALGDAAPTIDGAVSPTMQALVGLADGLAHEHAPPPDPALATLLRSYHALSPGRRAAFLRIVVPLVALLAELAAPEAAA